MIEWLDILKLSIPVSLAFFGWLFNESRKTYWQRRNRKETRYIGPVRAPEGLLRRRQSGKQLKTTRRSFLNNSLLVGSIVLIL